MKRFVLATTLLASPVAAREPAPPAGLKVERVVLMMRHGVRPPTKSPPMPAGTATEPWPSWSVPPGYLTQHGARAVALIGGYDRAAWRAAGLLPRTGCSKIRIVADSDQRTIATAETWAAAVAPGCVVRIEHKPQDVADPVFSPIDERATAFDADAARAAVIADAGTGGIAAAEAQLRSELARLDTILCAPVAASCGVAREPSGLTPAQSGKRPKLTGALDRASTAAQILLLEYADGKPMAEVGWGRATPGDVARLSALHAAEFRLLARPRYVARANLALIAPIITSALMDANAPAITMISGHDTNVASLGGLLGVHWTVPGLATDDPSPGGALVLQRLRDRRGNTYFRTLYRSQSIEQIRRLVPLSRAAPYVAVLPIEGCTALGMRGLCTAADFRGKLSGTDNGHR